MVRPGLAVAGSFIYDGTGALNFNAVNGFTGTAALNGGTTTIAGPRRARVLTGALTVNPSGAIPILDDTGTNTATRLGGRHRGPGRRDVQPPEQCRCKHHGNRRHPFTLSSGQSVTFNLVNNSGGGTAFKPIS